MGRSWAAVGGLVVLAACGGSGSGAGPAAPGPAVLTVGGQYTTVVTLTEDTCGGTIVMSVPTTVTQTPGAAALSLLHGSTTWPGTVSADGSFRTDAVAVAVSDGSVHTLRIEGRFTASGFEATVTSTVRRANGSECRYLVRWVGTKQGSPNVLP